MFQIDEYLKSCDIFNELLVKRFEENFNPLQNNLRLWTTPGHIVFTTDDNKVHTCDARPYDFSTSPSEAETDELLSPSSPVLEILFDTRGTATRMFIVLTNGDVQIFEYRILLYEWARIGYFNLNIVSPNSNSNHIQVTQVMISYHQNMIYWVQKSEKGFDLHKREVPLNGVREITQSAIGVPRKLLKNCPQFDITEIRDSICIVPHLPNSVKLYIILSARLHLWLFQADGKLLWRGIVGDGAIDFITLCMKTIGLWNQTGSLKMCKLLDPVKNHAYLFNDNNLICLTLNGEIRNSVTIDVKPKELQECFIIQNVLCIFTENYENLLIYNTNRGELIQSFDLTEFTPINGLWFNSSCIPTIGFHSSNHKIYKINYKHLSSLLQLDPPCLLQTLSLLKNDHFHVYSLLRDAIYHKFESCDIPPLKSMPDNLQSDGLLLAVLQCCREKGYESDKFPVEKMSSLFSSNVTLPETKLKELLDPITESFKKIEDCRISNLK
ncbi:hypothetical protein JTE90_000609 [Oedothorax gibbosus]|uniref:Uncharacterized protein n=1 Tax=Oedothorax gibbosus TaxID=931172 RepID=A0AAV6VXQ1_9ARAC|nr:hypothetical protein JTE90_000609 [Oedothorax gibbosus]